MEQMAYVLDWAGGMKAFSSAEPICLRFCELLRREINR